MSVRVHALETGRVQIHRRQAEPLGRGPLRLVATLLDREWTPWLPVLSWAVEHPDGLVVVDAGQDPDWRPARTDLYARSAVRFDAGEPDRLVARLAEAGLDPADVTHHVFTHLHVDHVGGAGTLPAATSVCSAAEWRAANRPGGRLRGLVAPEAVDRMATVDFEHEPVGPFVASQRLTADGAIRLLPTPGHTGGHLSVLVEADAGPRVLLAGDAVYSEAQLRADSIDGVCTHERAARRTLTRLRSLCAEAPTLLLPTHDPEAPARLAAGRATAPHGG